MSTDEFEVMYKSVTGIYVEQRLREGYAPLGFPGPAAAAEAADKKNHFETTHLLEYTDEPLDAIPEPVPQDPSPALPIPPLLRSGRPEPSKATRDFAKQISANEFLNTEIELLLTKTDIMSLCDRYFQLDERGEFRAKGKGKAL